MDESSCCDGSSWKREELLDHKFDFINVDEFADPGAYRRLAYSSVFIMTLKSILVYMADIAIVVSLFITGSFSNAITNANNTGCSAQGGFTPCVNGGIATRLIPLNARVWIISATILITFLLLYLDVKRANVIIASRDISYALTSTIAYRYYSLKSYPHYCLFNQISNSKKGIDALAFFVFFSLKGWKRLLLAEFPRQLINALNLFDIVVANVPATKSPDIFTAFYVAVSSIVARPDKVEVLGLVLSSFTVLMAAISLTSLLVAGLMYIPLVCVIQGNLKEYCCKKIDKRIDQLLRKISRKRVERARRAAKLEAQERAQRGEGEYESYDPSLPKRAPPPVGLNVGPALPKLDVDLDKPLKSMDSFIRRSLQPTGLPPSGFYYPKDQLPLSSSGLAMSHPYYGDNIPQQPTYTSHSQLAPAALGASDVYHARPATPRQQRNLSPTQPHIPPYSPRTVSSRNMDSMDDVASTHSSSGSQPIAPPRNATAGSIKHRRV
ncbi:hypothetical protein SmJEL517_g00762 [Synchytrium microbalum]|uniref:Uncharacterized protein n=1 Tax=Synchytrium microbalum TaxID=1806994 RepID=A0A507CIH9_9FUNG|nr:uncharacterized protein SmJEL517_g00762 [Synchytrium microbalum]TPX37463.1 hypothetical protein SmJEL517_g00762 [Synchytrium microbalum]